MGIGKLRLGALAAVAALALAGCGDDQDDAAERKELVGAVKRLQGDIRARDLDAVCRATTRDVHLQLGRSAHGFVSTCPEDLRDVLLMIEKGLAASPTPRIADVEIDGDEANVTLAVGDGSTTAVPFSRSKDRWLLANLYGAETLPEAKYGSPASLPTGPSATIPVAGQPASVATDAQPCPPVHRQNRHKLSGGCVSRPGGRKIEFKVRTAVGGFSLGRCEAETVVRLESDGRLWIDDLVVSGPNPCGDLQGCVVPENLEMVPWEGRLRAAGQSRLRGYLDICMDTCVGRFAGRVAVAALTDSRGWRLSFDEQPVGHGALVLDGAWIDEGRSTRRNLTW